MSEIYVWLRCSVCGYKHDEPAWQHTGESAAAGEPFPYPLGHWVTRCIKHGPEHHPDGDPIFTCSPEEMQRWLESEPPRDESAESWDWAHDYWRHDHPLFRVTYRWRDGVILPAG